MATTTILRNLAKNVVSTTSGATTTTDTFTSTSITTAQNAKFSDAGNTWDFDGKSFGTITLANGLEGTIYADFTSEDDIGPIVIRTSSNSNGGGVDSDFTASGDVTSLNVTATGNESFVSADVTAETGDITSIIYNATGLRQDGDISAYAAGFIGPITMNTRSLDSHTSGYFRSDDIGNLSLTLNGGSASGYFSAFASGGIGNITATANGNESYLDIVASANDDNIGAITINHIGVSAILDVSASAGGNIGIINVTQRGTYASADVSAYADGDITSLTFNHTGSFTSGDVSGYAGGTIGNVTFNLNTKSNDAILDYDVSGDAGVGNVSINLTGYSGEIDGQVAALSGSIGNVTITTKSVDNFVSGYFSAGDGDIGPILISNTGASADINFSAQADGILRTITILNTGNDSDVSGEFYAYGSGDVSGTVGNIVITNTGDSAYTSAYIEVDGGMTLGSTITINNNGNEADVSAYLDAQGGNIGNILLNNRGYSASAGLDFYASGTIGNVTINQFGDDGSALVYIDAQASGDIGNLTFNNTGDSAWVSGNFNADGDLGNIIINHTANGASGDYSGFANSGSVGTVSITATGDYNYVSADISAFGDGASAGEGSIGTVTLRSLGSYNDIYYSAYTYSVDELASAGNVGGNMGAITISQGGGTNNYTSVELDARSAGDIGNVTATLNHANYNENDLLLDLNAVGISDRAGNIGNVTVTMTNTNGTDNSAYVSAYANSGSIGNVTMTINGGANSELEVDLEAVEYDTSLGGFIGNITLNNTSYGGDTLVSAIADNGIGLSATAGFALNARVGGGDADGSFTLGSSGYIGNINIDVDATNVGGNIELIFDEAANSGGSTDIGSITVSGGSEASFLDISGSAGTTAVEADTMGVINLSTFLGSGYVDVSDVGSGGVTILTGQNDFEVLGSDEADTITAGAGDDIITGNDEADRINLGLGGEDTVIINADDTVDWTENSSAGGTITFGDGVEVITGFTSDDVLDIIGDLTTEDDYDDLDLGVDADLGLGDDSWAELKGLWNATSKVFTYDEDGADKLLLWDEDTTNATLDVQAVILLGAADLDLDKGDELV